MSEKRYTITKPEPFVIGSGQNKIPGGYVGKVILNKDQSTVFETIDITPQFCQQSCIYWCISQPPEEPPQEPIVNDILESSSSSSHI